MAHAVGQFGVNPIAIASILQTLTWTETDTLTWHIALQASMLMESWSHGPEITMVKFNSTQISMQSSRPIPISKP
jgi:hypothetical protein